MYPYRNNVFAVAVAFLTFLFLALDASIMTVPVEKILSPIVGSFQNLHPLSEGKKGYEVFGFAPYWTFDQLDNVDYNVLTTLSYFGIPVDGSGNLDLSDQGYATFKSEKATEVFRRAHEAGTRVVLTLTQMDSDSIDALMNDEQAQENAINQSVEMVVNRGIDGINVDFEYIGDPGQEQRDKFTRFVTRLTQRMHDAQPSSRVTVSVYASAVKEPKIYDIAALGKSTDGIFMMAYDFATTGADNAMPTSPLYGYKSGKYWYDVSTAVEDFITLMPADKLILGVPWYGYNYLVYQPGIKAETRPYYTWRGSPTAQTYSLAAEHISPAAVSNYQTGWDEDGQVGWKAYFVPETGTWRMIFMEDTVSLGKKYDFAKDKGLAGVGIWALGFDDGRHEMWNALSEKFGMKLADNTVLTRVIKEQI